MDLAAQFLVLLGIVVWLPRTGADPSRWFGARFAAAAIAATPFLFLGNVVAGVPLSMVVAAYAAIGGVGLAVAVVRLARHGIAGAALWLVHPVWVFLLLLLAISAWRGGLAYQPYLGDELISWLNLAKQIYLADNFWSETFDYHLPTYSNGWPLLVAAASSLYPTFSEARALSFLFLLHLGVIGFVYDLIRWHVQRRWPGKAVAAALIAWGAVLVLLTGEVTWRLLPTDLLIEHPLLYAFALCLLCAVLGQAESVNRAMLAMFIGVTLAAGYLFKVAMYAMLPAVGLFLLSFLWRDMREGGRLSWRGFLSRRALWLATLTFGPLAAAVAAWLAIAPGGQVSDSVGVAGDSDLALLFSATAVDLVRQMADDLLAFATLFKLPLTLVTLAVVVAASASRRYAPVVLGFLAFVLTYLAGMFTAYLFRYGFVLGEPLAYFQRFIILPIRLLHLLGFVILALEMVRLCPDRFAGSTRHRAVVAGLAVVAAVGLAWQVRALDRSVVDTAERRYQYAGLIQMVLDYKRKTARLVEIAEANDMAAPSVAVIDETGYDVAFGVARYYAISERRAGSFWRLRVAGQYRWLPAAAPQDDASAAPEIRTAAEQWAVYDILWPVSLTPAARSALGTLVDDAECAAAFDDHFLVTAGNTRFRCVPKQESP